MPPPKTQDPHKPLRPPPKSGNPAPPVFDASGRPISFPNPEAVTASQSPPPRTAKVPVDLSDGWGVEAHVKYNRPVSATSSVPHSVSVPSPQEGSEEEEVEVEESNDSDE